VISEPLAIAMVVATGATFIGTLGAVAMPRHPATAERHNDTANEFVGAPH
jgi:ABC-type spermidine/putrescine transport system permease subunit II